MTRSIGVRK